ncbi:MAG: phage head morphogenesis protein [Rhodanobacter sp. SCN 67-45]|nr:MAG: phage head morphogenesis protein [Rhodanobacter sp. SCN 67-45]
MRTQTRDRRKSRGPARARKAEVHYASQLRRVARQVGQFIGMFPPGDAEALPTITRMLEHYSDALSDWAVRTATKMLENVNQRDMQGWLELASEMSVALKDEIRGAPTGQLFKSLLDEQVELIKSLPRDAAKRVHELTIKGLEDSTRAKEIAKEIARSGEVTASRANLIARTEVARAASTLTQARAEHIGSTGYIWRTSRDSDVRHSHKQMEGKFVRWDSPPTLSDGTTTHAGQIYNCRCYPEPVIPEV